PGELPLLGHTLQLAWKRLEYLQSLRSLGNIVRVRIGTQDCYVIYAPELLRQVLVTDADKFGRGRLFAKAKTFAGNGMIVSDGTFHLRQRRLVAPAFHVNRLRQYVEVMRDEAVDMADGWQPGQVVAFDKTMHELSFAIAARALFRQGVPADTIGAF